MCRVRSRYSKAYEHWDALDHNERGLYFRYMNAFKLVWYFLWRMVAWMTAAGIAVGVLIAILIEILVYALGYAPVNGGGGVEEVAGALAMGAFIGGFIGVFPGIIYGLTFAS